MTMDGVVRDDDPVSDAEADALFADLADAPALVLGISGGPDSTALMVLAARWRARRKRGPKLIAVTVDHGLRAEGAKEALAVKRLARALGIAHRTLRWTGDKPKTGVQEAARAARYGMFARLARTMRVRHVLVAHSLDDQAETVLFRLARGSGLTGLRGMARVSPLPASGAKDVSLVRPLLTVPKSRLIATLKQAGIPFADDPSNRDPRFTRPRLRRLMPGLAAEGLDSQRLSTFARRAARADAALEQAADAAIARLGHPLDADEYARLPAEVSLRVLGRLVTAAGHEGPVELGKLESLHEALASGGRIRRTLAGALITLGAGRLTVEPAPPRRSGAQRRESGAKAGGKGCKGAFTNAK